MEDILRELAEEFESQMDACCKTKNETPALGMDAMLNREYWAGKEQAFYEAWQSVKSHIEED